MGTVALATGGGHPLRTTSRGTAEAWRAGGASVARRQGGRGAVAGGGAAKEGERLAGGLDGEQRKARRRGRAV